MSEATGVDTTHGSPSAGALLRAAREKQGLHVAALAAAIKIPQRKLEALEGDRHHELPDATFTRALAMTVCRALKIDPAPVLAQLPKLGAGALADVAGGLNAPFRQRAGASDAVEIGLARHPLVWAAVLVLIAAAAVYVLPTGWWRGLMPGDMTPAVVPAPAAVPLASPAGAASAVAADSPNSTATAQVAEAVVQAASAPVIEVVHSVPAAEAGASAAADAAAGVAVLRVGEASWIEAIDANGQVLLRRVLQPGETVGLDGKLPFKMTIGNALATQLQFRGQAVDLKPATRENIARLELK